MHLYNYTSTHKHTHIYIYVYYRHGSDPIIAIFVISNLRRIHGVTQILDCKHSGHEVAVDSSYSGCQYIERFQLQRNEIGQLCRRDTNQLWEQLPVVTRSIDYDEHKLNADKIQHQWVEVRVKFGQNDPNGIGFLCRRCQPIENVACVFFKQYSWSFQEETTKFGIIGPMLKFPGVQEVSLVQALSQVWPYYTDTTEIVAVQHALSIGLSGIEHDGQGQVCPTLIGLFETFRSSFEDFLERRQGYLDLKAYPGGYGIFMCGDEVIDLDSRPVDSIYAPKLGTAPGQWDTIDSHSWSALIEFTPVVPLPPPPPPYPPTHQRI